MSRNHGITQLVMQQPNSFAKRQDLNQHLRQLYRPLQQLHQRNNHSLPDKWDDSKLGFNFCYRAKAKISPKKFLCLLPTWINSKIDLLLTYLFYMPVILTSSWRHHDFIKVFITYEAFHWRKFHRLFKKGFFLLFESHLWELSTNRLLYCFTAKSRFSFHFWIDFNFATNWLPAQIKRLKIQFKRNKCF